MAQSILGGPALMMLVITDSALSSTRSCGLLVHNSAKGLHFSAFINKVFRFLKPIYSML